MEQFIEFVVNHWALCSAFVILLFLLIFSESKKAGSGIGNSTLTQLVNREDAVVIDLRKKDEFSQGSIANAKSIPYEKFSERMKELEKYKDNPIILICKIGQHSREAAKLLHASDYKKVYRLNGGLSGWTADKLPLVKT